MEHLSKAEGEASLAKKKGTPTEADAPGGYRVDRSHNPPELARLGNRSLKCFCHQRLVVSLSALA